MAKLPSSFKQSKQQIDDIKTKSYLGPSLAFSSLGNECFRAVWLSFRWCTIEEIGARTQRIFDRGNLEEERVIKDLVAIGCKVTNEQENVFGFENYSKGKIDGEVEDLPEAPNTTHLLEIKTMKDSKFQKLISMGLKRAEIKYYRIIQLYMHYRKLTRALIVVTNKNDEERYHERIRYDKTEADRMVERSKSIITCGDVPMIEQPFSPSYYLCRWCKHGNYCYSEGSPEITCRSCVHCDLIGDGKWVCAKQNDKELDREDQISACKQYKRLF